MGTIWEIMMERLGQSHDASEDSRVAPAATGFLASRRLLRIIISGIRSLRISFFKVQDALKAVASIGVVIGRSVLPVMGGAYTADRGGRSRAPALFPGRGKAARPGRSLPFAVRLSVTAAGGLARVAGAWAAAAHWDLPQTCEESVLRGGVDHAGAMLEAPGIPRVTRPHAQPEMSIQRARGVEGEADHRYARSAGSRNEGGSVESGEVAAPEGRAWGARKSEARRAVGTGTLSGASVSSNFLATAALLGVQALAAFSQISRAGFALQQLPHAAARAPAPETGAGGAAASARPRHLGAALAYSIGRDGTPVAPARTPQSSAKVGPLKPTTGLREAGTFEVAQAGIFGSGAESLGISYLREGMLEGGRELRSGSQATATGGRAYPLGGTPREGGVEPASEAGSGVALPPEESAPIRGFPFFPSLALGRIDLQKGTSFWKTAIGAISPAFLALSKVPSPPVQWRLAARLGIGTSEGGGVGMDSVAETSVTEGARPGALRAPSPMLPLVLEAPNIAALAAEVSANAILPQIPVSAGIGSGRTVLREAPEAETERMPAPMELEEPRVYPTPEIRVDLKVEGEEDLWELRRKIARILEDEMRRHYGEG